MGGDLMSIATFGDRVACGGTVIGGSGTVRANGKPVAFVGCVVTPCPKKPTSFIATGNYTVLVNGSPCARLGSVNSHGSPIVTTGAYTVFVP
tara:strand:- start:210 stop:485 length:276 start_codon:yes stop_codon:yes gene_type:complete